VNSERLYKRSSPLLCVGSSVGSSVGSREATLCLFVAPSPKNTVTAPKPTVGYVDSGGGVRTKPDPSVVSVETQSPVFTQVWTTSDEEIARILCIDVPCNDVGGMLHTVLEQRPRYLPLPSM
jgi:hypothetical protein